MASLIAEWDSAIGMEPPPPQTPDCYRVYVKYRGGWNHSFTVDECGNLKEFTDVPNGEYYVEVHGLYDGEISKEFGHATLIVTGGSAPVNPTYGSPPPSGNANIAAPGSVTLSEA